MWVHLDDKEAELLKKALYHAMASTMHDEAKALRDKIIERETEEPLAATYRNAVETSDELEVDDDAIVSLGDDPGAWVHAWVWVTNSQAGIEDPEADEDDDFNVCRSCGEHYVEGGDGFDGECPDCADKTDQKLHPENYE